MSTTTEHQFRDLTGQTLGCIEVSNIARRNPLAWTCRCTNCGSQFVLSHLLAQQGACPRGPVACRRVAPVEVSQGTMTRAFIQERRQQPAPAAPQPTFNPNADPHGMQGYLDSLERQQKERG